jgi:uncharacterized protein YheU (UPF0270 family)
MEIPHRQLSAEALRGVIEEFVTREGTDYGAVSVCLSDKVRQVRDQLDRGEALLVYDPETSTCNIIPAAGLGPSSAPPATSR